MEIEFHFRTYNSSGRNDTLLLLSKWCSPQLKSGYGGGISTVLFEACCHNDLPPKATLEKVHSNFEEWLTELPFAQLAANGSELRICFEAPLYRHTEVARDSQVLAVKTFRNMLSKAAKTLHLIHNPDRSFDALDLANDLQQIHAKAPQRLRDLVSLYLDVHEQP